MKKEKSMNSLSEFPTEVLVFYFKKFRTVKHYEYENDWEYYSNTNVDDYIYNITLNLK